MPDVNYIDLYCTGQRLYAKYKSVVASNGMNNVKCRFHFDDCWDGLAKTAIFTTDQPYKQSLDDQDECFIPALAMVESGYVEISVYGRLNGVMRQTSTVLPYEIKQGSDVDAEDIIANIKIEAVAEMKSEIIATLTQIYVDAEVEEIPNLEELTIDELITEIMLEVGSVIRRNTETKITERTKTAIVNCLTQIAEYYELDSTDYTDMSVYQVIADIPTTLNSAVSKTLSQDNNKDAYELSQALQSLTHDDYSGVDFNGLIEVVGALVVSTEEDVALSSSARSAVDTLYNYFGGAENA